MHSSLKKTKSVVLVGQPNAGKTTLFNALTGSHFQTGNYPGVTVDYSYGKPDSKFKTQNKFQIVDSPGLNSLNAKSEDEKVTVSCLANHPKFGSPDLVICVVDSTQLSRQLYLLKQLKESNFKIIVAVTMLDVLSKKNLRIDFEKLEQKFGIAFLEVNGRNKNGIQELLEKVDSKLSEKEVLEPKLITDFSKEYILGSFKEIAEIEHEVLHHTESNLKSASEKLKIISQASHTTRKADEKLFLHPFLGGILFLVIMGSLFTSIYWLAAPLMDLVDAFFGMTSELVAGSLPDSVLKDLIIDGLIAGVGSVIIFVPQIMILFLLMGILEDSGYLSRAAVIIDWPLKKLGLSGRSFVPMLSGFACAIPGMMAARTIPNFRERILTIFVMPLMSCGARLPVYALLLTFITPEGKPWIGGISLMFLYVASLFFGSLAAGIAKKFIQSSGDSIFSLELPSYKFPVPKLILRSTFNRTKSYVTNAGIPIIVISLILWFFTYFPGPPNNIPEEEQLDRIEYSYASNVSKVLEPVLHPMGADWRVGVSLIASFAAREVFVSSLALIFHVTGEDDDGLQENLLQSMREAKIQSTGEKLFTFSTVLGLLVFFNIALQCLTTVAVAKKETGGWKIPLIQVITYTGVAYVLAIFTVQGLRLLGFD